ncbi:hypothetical protein [Ferruginibacter sp. HRS2-29]|uniref:hypothetical protein n=1 Tax=Ferruginibacter sp. HRS2-29 TaxID=2487334 RepID=UPI0020CC846F|nr:hypothetical protein [Ferruginibacter sp. HRS2-29]MCP9752747.1 hypothetical protein [Ferruginibacter sp. HRS2-29]
MRNLFLCLLGGIAIAIQSCAPDTPQRDYTWVYTNWGEAKNSQPAFRCLEPGNTCVKGSSHPLPPRFEPTQWRTSADSLFTKLKTYEAGDSLNAFFSDTIQWQSLVPPSIIGYDLINDVKNNLLRVGIGSDSSIFFYQNNALTADSIVLIWKWNE